jgi:uncharacterized membrane protein YraQ (UPF0718 family)
MINEISAMVIFVATAVWEILPAFFISVFLGVLVRELQLDSLIRHAFNKRLGLSIGLSTAVGAFSPFCSCTVVPVINGLLVSGVPLAPVMAFWIASPLMDPEIFSLSVALLGWPLACARLGATLLLSLGAGFVTLALTRSGILSHIVLREQTVATPSCCPASLAQAAAPLAGAATLSQSQERSCCDASSAAPSVIPLTPTGARTTSAQCVLQADAMSVLQPQMRVQPAPGWTATVLANARTIQGRLLTQHVMRQSWGLGRWLLLAFLLQALLLRYVPQAAIAGVIGSKSMFAVPLAALVGIPLYLGNVSALPIVSGLLSQGMQSGAAIAFLIAGPVTTVPAMSAVWGIVQQRVFALYLGIGLFGAMFAGTMVNMILR